MDTLDPSVLLAALAAIPGAGPYVAVILPWLLLIGGICAAVDATFPQPVAGSKWVPVRKIVAWAGLNLGHARNAVPAGLPAAAKDLAEKAATVREGAVAVATAAPALEKTLDAVTAAPEAIAKAQVEAGLTVLREPQSNGAAALEEKS